MPEKPTYEELEEKILEFERDEFDRKQVKEDLQLTQFSVDNSTDAVYWMGPDAKFIYVNHAAVAALGYSKKELLTMTVHDIGPEFPADIWPAHWTELKEKKSFAIQTIHQRKDGSTFPVEITVNFIQFGSKEINCAIAKDITERNQAEEALRERTRELNERVKELNCLYGISNLVEKPGISLDEVIQGSVDLIPPSWHYPEITCSRIILENKEYKTENFKETVWKQSKEIFVHGNLAGIVEVCYLEEKVALDEGPFLKEERALINAIAGRLGRIIERKHAEVALKRTQRLLTEAQRIGRVGGWEFDIDTGKQTWSEEVYNIHEVDLTYDPTVREGVNFYTSASRPIIEQAVQRVVNHSEPFDVELEIITAKGNPRSVHAIGKADLENNRVYGFFQDITETRHLQAQLQQATKMEAIATLAGGIAHEFNNALMGVLGNIELLKWDLPEDERRDASFEAMNESGHRMSRLTDQLLAYAEGGQYNPNDLKPDDFLMETLPILQHDFNSEVRVETRFQKDISYVRADHTQMQMVLSAILTNSNEAIEDEGLIKISAENKEIDEAFTKQHPGLKPGLYVCLTIEDDGEGMDAETRNGIFEPFFTTKFQGRGMGMAAVYGIIKSHDGAITVDSEPGKGTVVHIYLPAVEAKEEAKAVKQLKTEIAMGEGTVLIIEDEEPLLDLFRQILERLGYRVLMATTGKQAVELARTFDGQIELALLDIKLPDMDGGRVYPLIMEARPDLKVIVCSGYSIDGPAQAILDAGAEGFIQKPFSIAPFAEKLKEVLEGK